MCPIWPLHLIILYLMAFCPLWFVCQALPNFTTKFEPSNFTVHMGHYYDVNVTLEGLDTGFSDGDEVYLMSSQDHVATSDFSYQIKKADIDTGTWKGPVKIYGNFLGYTALNAAVKTGPRHNEVSSESLNVTVIRPERVIDKVFTYSVAIFVSLIFINFGCAMDWSVVMDVLKRPIGPGIGLCVQYIFMPLVTFGMGFLIFPDHPNMRLGMFCTGVSPGGGSSNIWTFMLGGNLNLSLAMTAISTVLSFGLMPAWLFSLGQVVFKDANIVVPYARIGSFVFGLIVPLAIGLAMQRWTPKLSAFMVRMLKCFSSILLVFIVVFAIVTNLYIFELFSWQMYAAGMVVPWVGYVAGYAAARLLRQSAADALAVAIEVGNHNTGLSIFLLRVALPQPDADIASVVPVAVAIMSPLPMIAIYAVQKVMGCYNSKKMHIKILDEETSCLDGSEPKSIAFIETPIEKYN